MQTYTVKSLKEYLEHIEKFDPRSSRWYRGHSLSSYRLEPSLFRTKMFKSNERGYPERSITRPGSGNYELMDHSIAEQIMREAYLNKHLSRFDVMCKNQHNGIPTRLLDFSTDPLIALFFCLENRKYWNESHTLDLIRNPIKENDCVDEYSGSVYLLDPIHLNKNTISKSKIVNKEEEIDYFFDGSLPYAVESQVIDERIRVQKGKFLVFSYMLQPLEEYSPIEESMIRFTIPNSCKAKIMLELREKGITYHYVYPDIEGFAKEALYRMEMELSNRIQNVP